MQHFIFFLLFSFCTSYLTAQTNLSLSIQNDKKETIEGAIVTLLKQKDSSIIKSGLSDQTGAVSWSNVKADTYLVTVKHIGYQTFISTPIVITTSTTPLQLPTIILQKQSGQLSEVTVVSKKPFIQRLNDRIVVNVEGSLLSAGSTALDILERSPGITLDQNESIVLKGKSGVIIMIDGKPSPLSSGDLTNYLRSLPSNSIERIDIITNPSAKYDAAGSSGIIDIRFKKDQRFGTNGSVNAGYGQGNYARTNTGLTFNHRTKAINLYGNANYQYIKPYNNIISLKDFYTNNIFTGSYDQDNMVIRRTHVGNGRIGIDFFTSDKTVIGFIINSNRVATNRTNNNSTTIFNAAKQPVSLFLTTMAGIENAGNEVINSNIKHQFNKTGHEITFDADYGRYHNKWLSDFSTKYADINGTPTQIPYLLDGNQKGLLTIKSVKSDYAYPFKKGGKLEAGIKTSFVKSENNVVFLDKSNGSPVVDNGKTNHFVYDENINAAYINFQKDIGKINVQLGLRSEQTNIGTLQKVNNVKMDSSYLLLFPSAFLTYKFSEKQSLGISVSRRIDRPSYNLLNPFRNFIDPSFYASGNPSLKPELTWSYELNYSIHQLNLSLNYSKTTNFISVVLMPEDIQNKITVQLPVNISSNDYWALAAVYPLKINKWWNSIINATAFSTYFQGNVANTVINQKAVNTQASIANSFTLKKGWSAEISFNYNSGSNNGILRFKPQYIAGAAIQKTILNNKGNIRLNVTDIFWSQWPRAISTFAAYTDTWRAQRDTRIMNLSFTYRFGNNKVQGSRRRTTASEDERRRAGG